MKNLLNSRNKIILFVIILVGVGVILWQAFKPKSTTPQYTTSTAAKGTVVSTVSASGNVAAGDTVNITTTASGFVSQLYVKIGDTVTQGQKIADVTLDRDGQQRLAAAYSSYLSGQNQINSAQASLFSLQSSLYSKWQTFTNLAENSTYTNSDGSPNIGNRTLPQFTTSQDDWFNAEAQFKNQQNVIAQAQASANNSWLTYQEAQSAIVAPSSGVIANLAIAQGVPVTVQTSTSNNVSSTTPVNVATIKLAQAHTLAVVDLAEVDAPKVQTGQKVTMTLDAFPNQTFTGHILIVNTSGTVSSGVTTYPATIAFDTSPGNIYPNMAVTANIITGIQNNVVLVPTAAVTTTSGESTVRVLKNGQVTTVTVQTGNSDDTNTAITSGINEGDVVVTGQSAVTTTTTTGSASPFGAIRGGGFGGGGGAARGR
jgi:membrane fusion protein, macrolide-specific efflux system